MVIDVLAEFPSTSRALAVMVCVPRVIFLPCQEAEQEVVLAQICRVVLSPFTVMDLIPAALLAVATILIAPLFLIVIPFAGELMTTAGGGTGVVTIAGEDWAEVPAAL